MLKNCATAKDTLAYAQRHPELPGNFRPMLGGLSVSSVGIGTYLGEPDAETDQAYAKSLRRALLGGINLIDTAVNYRFQRAERTIGKVLAELVAAGELRREEIVVATKGGYVTFDGTMPPNPRAWFEEKFVSSGLVGPGDLVEGSHCMTPKWLGAMLEMSRANLGLETIDLYYLHNPETQLNVVSRPEFLSRIRAAFEMLEGAVADGKIGVYGTATWNGYRVPPTERAWMRVSRRTASERWRSERG
jgi:aryl-alcohol dehydrogenase-like predicted oxidoreductase